jgi:anionic cell wall polymer biosynthesis LytR-Cps2A-Psr (LCP) family protein
MKKEKNPEKTKVENQEPKKEYKYSNNLLKLFIKTNLLAIFFLSIMLLITAIGAGIWGVNQVKKFSQTAGVTISELREKVQTGWEQEPIQTNGYKNILLLGVDSLSGRGDVPPLTDTMMLMSVNLDNGEINTLPFPRDLWSEKYQTKINALYFYGLERYPENPERFTKETLEEMTNIEIHHTVVLSLDKLEELINLLGGVRIDIPVGFTDENFPRPGVDVTIERDPKILYETISFEPGEQTLSGERALQYIRSRHSDDDEGTDISRGERQQLVIKAIFSQLTNFKQYLKNPELAGQLYKFYDQEFSNVFSIEEIVATGKKVLPAKDNIKIESHQFTTTKDDPINGVLDNPKPSYLYQNQWVYIINDQKLFTKEVNSYLF